MRFDSSYMGCIYRDPKKYVILLDDVVKKVLKLKKTLKFHAIAFRGTSGAALAYPISIATGIPLICVRKPSDKAHGGPVEGSSNTDVKKYLIIDDFMSTGDTIKAIIDAIDMKRRNYSVKCVGILLYGDDYGSFKTWKKIPITRMK